MLLWGNLGLRMTPCIPAVNPNLPLGEIMYLPGNHFGFMLGKGMVGSVYQLSADQEGEEQVVKVVDKSRTRDLHDLNR